MLRATAQKNVNFKFSVISKGPITHDPYLAWISQEIQADWISKEIPKDNTNVLLAQISNNLSV